MNVAPANCSVCDQSESNLPEGTTLLRCGRCKATRYCSKECQSAAWKEHKKTCTPSFDSDSQPASAPGRKRVVLITLKDFSWLDDMYNNFYTAMRDSCEFIKVSKVARAVNEISTFPAAIILFEPSLMKKAESHKHESLNNALVAYAKAGGTVIFGCQCSNHVTPPDLKWYFSTVWALPWQMEAYSREDFNAIVPMMHGIELPKKYNVKAVQLQHVNREALVYAEPGQTDSGPVIWSEHEKGWVAWLGDVNNEEETREITMRICGL